MRTALIVLAGVVVLAVGGCGGSESAAPPAASPPVQDLASLEPLQQAFDADSGNVRLLLILSPT